MLKFRNKTIYYKTEADECIIMYNTTVERFNAFEAHLKKIYGEIPNLVTIKHEVIHFF